MRLVVAPLRNIRKILPRLGEGAGRRWRRVDNLLGVLLVVQSVGAIGVAGTEGMTGVGAHFALAASVLCLLLKARGFALVAALWFLIEPTVEFAASPGVDGLVDLLAHASRYGIGIALVAPSHLIPVLCASASLTFIGHGVEALMLKPIFVDYLAYAGNLAGVALSTSHAELVLRGIGAVDVGAGLALARRRSRTQVLAYMVYWGVITALFRVVFGGGEGLPEALLRVANGGVPLVLLWLLQKSVHASRSDSLVNSAIPARR